MQRERWKEKDKRKMGLKQEQRSSILALEGGLTLIFGAFNNKIFHYI